jgi:hypothetical protein
MTSKVNAKVLIDYKKYMYLLGLQPKSEEVEQIPKNFSAEEDREEETTMKKSGIVQDTSVDQLAHMHKELLDNQSKMQNIAEKNFKTENSTIKASMTKDEPKLVTNLPVQAKFVKKRERKPKPYKKKVNVAKMYKEKEIVRNGEKWYRLK